MTDRLWSALCSGTGEPHGLVAVQEGVPTGLAHYFFVPSTSDWAPRCYLQDLFTAPEARGTGLGHALIRAVYAAADARGASQTYWLTAQSNTRARRLYDHIGQITPFVKYMR